MGVAFLRFLGQEQREGNGGGGCMYLCGDFFEREALFCFVALFCVLWKTAVGYVWENRIFVRAARHARMRLLVATWHLRFGYDYVPFRSKPAAPKELPHM